MRTVANAARGRKIGAPATSTAKISREDGAPVRCRGRSGGACLGGARAIVACSEISPTTFGNPNTLDRKSIPGEGGVEELVCSGGDAGDGGGFDGGCPSFATDIYPYLAAAGPWRCADKACHGGASAPPIDGTNAAACLASLKKISVKTAPYVPYPCLLTQTRAVPPSAVQGTADPAHLGGYLDRAATEFRFADYAADVSATNLGERGIVVREQYRSIPN